MLPFPSGYSVYFHIKGNGLQTVFLRLTGLYFLQTENVNV